jgi:predicted nucleotidyltransferase
MRSSDVPSHPVLAGHALRHAIREAVQQLLDIERYQVFIFGSEATGVADRRSDIDIGILGPQPVPGAIVQQIRERLEGVRTLRAFDVVDFCSVDESFKAKALEHAERL